MNFECKGIIRKLENTGRIVIPKEIRNVLRLKEGDSIEMCIFGNTLCLQKVGETIDEPKL